MGIKCEKNSNDGIVWSGKRFEVLIKFKFVRFHFESNISVVIYLKINAFQLSRICRCEQYVYFNFIGRLISCPIFTDS